MMKQMRCDSFGGQTNLEAPRLIVANDGKIILAAAHPSGTLKHHMQLASLTNWVIGLEYALMNVSGVIVPINVAG